MSVSLLKEKLERILKLVNRWLTQKHCTKRELDSLIGQLQHASTVVRAGRSMLQVLGGVVPSLGHSGFNLSGCQRQKYSLLRSWSWCQ